jgi:16S rRNA (guanine527-N7)-methyltransferase
VDAATKTRLGQGAAAIGTALDPSALERLARYFDLLLQWNRKINLTAITDPAQVVDRHFVDSLAVAPLLGGAQTLVDVGSGGGFPGAVLAVLRPDLRVTAVDSVRKKVAFLETLRMELAPNLEPIATRHDDLIRAGRTFDAAVSRATWDPVEWVRQGAALVRPGGLLIAMQTTDQTRPDAPPGFTAEPVLTYRIENVPRHLCPFRRHTESPA